MRATEAATIFATAIAILAMLLTGFGAIMLILATVPSC